MLGSNIELSRQKNIETDNDALFKNIFFYTVFYKSCKS